MRGEPIVLDMAMTTGGSPTCSRSSGRPRSLRRRSPRDRWDLRHCSARPLWS